jgi:uncharacterized protein (DUF427 family)
MSLTFGTAPFSHQHGIFNFDTNEPDAVLYWEDFPKRMRVEFNDQIIADSRSVKALHETDHFMQLYFPREDVDMVHLKVTDHHTECPYKGEASYWTIKVGGREAENAAWSYEEPLESSPPIDGYMAFYFNKMDAWYQEDEKVYAHLRNPYHRFDVHRSSRKVTVRHNGTVITETIRPQMLFETGLPPRYYLPKEDVRVDLLKESKTVTECPYKGSAQHWHLNMSGESIEDAAWSLPNPIGEAQQVSGHICFYPQKVETEVDGEVLQA